MAINHCVRVASYSAKRWHLESGSSVLSFFHSIMWLRRCAACQSLCLTMDMAWQHVIVITKQRMWGYGCFFSSPSCDGCLLCICSEELSVWGTGVVHFGTKLQGIGVRGHHNRLTWVEPGLSGPCERVNPGSTWFWCACERVQLSWHAIRSRGLTICKLSFLGFL